MGLIKEFKEFALKGNFFDMAIGVVIGGAFGTIVTSLIKDIIMPVVSLPGNVDFTKSLIVLKENAADPAKSITLNYGAFVTVLINFLILAFVLFLVVKMYNAARKKFEAEKPAAAPAGPTAGRAHRRHRGTVRCRPLHRRSRPFRCGRAMGRADRRRG